MPTETFIYNYLTAFRQITPICFTFRRVNEESFPYHHPIIELYKWNIFYRYSRSISHLFIPFNSKLRFDISKTYKAIDRCNVKILHAHFGYTGTEVLPVKKKTGLPLVTTFYGQDISEMAESSLWKKAYEELFSEGDMFLIEGPHMRDRLIQIGCPPAKARIQRIAIHLHKYPFRKRFPKPKNQIVKILFCGTFGEKKGLIYALAAVRRAYDKFSRLEFRIIGDGPLRPQIADFIKKQRMDNYTILLGFLTHKQMIEEMNSADLFIHPSITTQSGDSEGGAPTTILEAQACGLPIISSMHADIPNVVIPGSSALLSKERDVDALEQNLLHLLNIQDKWMEMGTIGRSFIEDNHNISTEVIKLEDLYKYLIESK